jgi:hypothetical protein
MLRCLRTGSRWNWLLWWRIDRTEIELQAARYGELPLGDTFAGLAVYLLLADIFLICLSLVLNGEPAAAFFDPALMLTLALGVYRGQRWAMLAAMLIWTLEKISQAIDHPGLIAICLPWWTIGIHALYMALLVERRRANPDIELVTFDTQLRELFQRTRLVLEPALRAGGIWLLRMVFTLHAAIRERISKSRI